MPEKRTVETATAVPGETRATAPPPPAPKLAKAAESGDPSVQHLLANRSAAESAGNVALLAEVNAALAALGYE